MKKRFLTMLLVAAMFAVTGTTLVGCAPPHHLAGPPPAPPAPPRP